MFKIIVVSLLVVLIVVVAADLYERHRQIGVRERQGNDL